MLYQVPGIMVFWNNRRADVATAREGVFARCVHLDDPGTAIKPSNLFIQHAINSRCTRQFDWCCISSGYI